MTSGVRPVTPAVGPEPRILTLCGGLGGARLALAFHESGLADHATFVTNVADDAEIGRYLVCPDTDAVTYALSGRFDEERGWGVVGDRFESPPPGAPSWFGLGTLDLVTHQVRRAALDRGATLTAATAEVTASYGIAATVLPATDDSLRTMLRCGTTWRSFQEWLVRDHASPVPDEVLYAGGESARPGPRVISAIEAADVVVLAPSSPVASLLPTLGLPGVRAALARRRKSVIAVSSLVQGRAPTCDRDRSRSRSRAALLAAAGLGSSVPEVASLWVDVAATFVVDPDDATDADAVAALGLQVVVAPTTADTPARRRELLEVLAASRRRSSSAPVAY